MARTKTTEMSTITAAQLADGDLIPVIDVSDTTMSSTGTNKKLAKSQLAEAAGVTAHLADTSDAHDASAISFSATGNIVATDVQAAIAELDSEKAAVAEPIAAAHIADTSAAHAASAVSFSATGSISSTDVQAAIAEVDSDLTAHTGDTSDAHDASAISVLDTAGNYTATDVEGVLAELPSRFASVISADAYGVAGDGQYAAGVASMTSGSAVLGVSSALFAPADVGKLISVTGAGAAGTFLNTTIAAYTSATQVTLAAAAGTTVADENVQWATDDTTALTNWLAALGDAEAGFCSSGVYGVTTSLTLGNYVPPNGRLVNWDNVRLFSHVTSGPVIDMGEGWQFTGRLTIECNKASGSIGLRYTGTARDTSVERVDVFRAASAGIQFRSQGSGVFYNDIGYCKVRYGLDKGIEFLSDGATNNVNANRIGQATVQNNAGDGVVINGGDGNSFDYLECESNTGWGIKLTDGYGFFVNGGWLEGNTAGNITVADDPAVRGVYIRSVLDSGTVTVNYSGNRSVLIENGNSSGVEYGKRGLAALDVGPAGVAAADQDDSLTGNRLRVSGGMKTYRRSSGTPWFAFYGSDSAAATPTGYRWYEDNTTLIAEVSSANGMRVSGTLKSITGGLDIQPGTSTSNVRVLTSGAGLLVVNGTGGIANGGSSGPQWRAGSGSPEGSVTAPIGSIYSRTDGGASTSLYVKESGTGNTGWVAK